MRGIKAEGRRAIAEPPHRGGDFADVAQKETSTDAWMDKVA